MLHKIPVSSPPKSIFVERLSPKKERSAYPFWLFLARITDLTEITLCTTGIINLAENIKKKKFRISDFGNFNFKG